MLSRIIAAVSGKGGTGKTTTVANLGVCLAAFGKATLLIDLDIGLRNLDLALGLQDSVSMDVLDVINGDCTLQEAIVQSEKYPRLSFLSAAQFKEKASVSFDELQTLLETAKPLYEFILLDCPAGLGENVTSAVSVADTALIVVNHDPFSLRDGDRIAGLICEKYEADLKLMVNRYKIDLVRNGKMPNILQVVENMAVQLIGAVPDSDAVLLSGYSGTPIVCNKKSGASKAYFEAAKRLLGEKIPLLDIPVKKRALKRNKSGI